MNQDPESKFWIQYPKADIWYQKILDTFHFSPENDQKARDFLFDLKKHQDPSDLIQELSQKSHGKTLLFIGAGPNLERHLVMLSSQIHQQRSKCFIVAADGSANALRIVNLLPDVIISDLDGITSDECSWYIEQEITILIHGHGDNLAQLQQCADIIRTSPNVIGTTQIPAKYPIINPGGFTDGDRGIYFFHHITHPKQPFWLLGYDFGDIIGSFSKKNTAYSQVMTSVKRKKLDFAQILLAELVSLYQRPIIYYGRNPIDDRKLVQRIHI